jgi:cysteine/O-acetylserine efflux protein
MSTPSFLIFVIVTAITPGPNTILAMINAGKVGFRRSMPFNLGIYLGTNIVMVICALFSSTLYALIPTIKSYMLVIGAAYLLWLAWKTYHSGSDFKTTDQREQGFMQGVLLQFVNPKIFIYGLTAFSTYVLQRTDNLSIIVIAGILLATAGFVAILMWAAFGSLFRRLFSEHGKVINTIMALLLVYVAASLFLS